MNAKLLMLLAPAASVLILASPTVGAAAPSGHAGPSVANKTVITPQPLSFLLSCALRGKSVFASRTDVALINKGVAPVPVGTKVRWIGPIPWPGSNPQGYYTFASALAPGQEVVIPGVLPNLQPMYSSCTVTVV
jgi:hypothetical protein